jgi:hypothetical protein
MQKKIYSYYEAIPSVEQREEFSCANLWKGSWENNGWECVMLNKTHTSSSPLFRELVGKMLKVEKMTAPVMSRFSRWCALHAVGGGWMSDYDVLNLGFSPKEAEENEVLHPLQLVAGEKSYIFYATADKAEQVIRNFINESILNDGVPVPESNIVKETFFSPDFSSLFHPGKDEEKTRSQQMAEKIAG